jgi:hypothetical protein
MPVATPRRGDPGAVASRLEDLREEILQALLMLAQFAVR